VKWSGYGTEASSWEPPESFDTPETLLAWGRKKREIDQGRVPPFDVEAWEIHVQNINDKKAQRKERRRAKRRRFVLASLAPGPQNEQPAEAGSNRPAPTTGHKRKLSTTSIGSPEDSELFVSLEHSMSPAPIPQSAQEAVSSTVSSSLSDRLLGVERVRRVSDPRPAVSPPKQPVPPLEKPPLVGFGTDNTLNKRGKPKSWGEPVPDVSQLQLMKPSDFPARTARNLNPSLRTGPAVSAPTASSTLNQLQLTTPPLIQPTANAEHAQAINTSPPALSSPKATDSLRTARPVRQLNGRISSSRQSDTRLESDCYRPEGLFRDSPPLLDSYRPRHDNGFRTSRSPSPRSARGERNESKLQKPFPAHDEAPTSVEEQIKRLPASSPGRAAMFFHQDGIRYFCNPGEALVQVYWGPEKKYVGPVRVCGASKYRAVTSTLMKDGPGSRIEMWFRYLGTFEEYSALCPQVSLTSQSPSFFLSLMVTGRIPRKWHVTLGQKDSLAQTERSLKWQSTFARETSPQSTTLQAMKVMCGLLIPPGLETLIVLRIVLSRGS
jgi:chromo domain-containing protein 1